MSKLGKETLISALYVCSKDLMYAHKLLTDNGVDVFIDSHPNSKVELDYGEDGFPLGMMECEKHGATCDVCDARNCLSRNL